MSDDETKQLLREMLAAQREQLTLLTKIVDYQARGDGASAANETAYRKELNEWHTQHSTSYWIAAVHTVTMAAVVGLLIYVVVYVLRSH